MKKLISVLFVIALLLCSAALAEAKTITPVDPGYDLSALADGIYPVYFDQDAVADGKAALSIYSEDMFDIVDIATLEVGDTRTAAKRPCPWRKMWPLLTAGKSERSP